MVPAPVEPLRIVFVCSGNICRSPIAEKVLQFELERAGLADGGGGVVFGFLAFLARSCKDGSSRGLIIYDVGIYQSR